MHGLCGDVEASSDCMKYSTKSLVVQEGWSILLDDAGKNLSLRWGVRLKLMAGEHTKSGQLMDYIADSHRMIGDGTNILGFVLSGCGERNLV
jgi:hypothetical protein